MSSKRQTTGDINHAKYYRNELVYLECSLQYHILKYKGSYMAIEEPFWFPKEPFSEQFSKEPFLQ